MELTDDTRLKIKRTAFLSLLILLVALGYAIAEVVNAEEKAFQNRTEQKTAKFGNSSNTLVFDIYQSGYDKGYIEGYKDGTMNSTLNNTKR